MILSLLLFGLLLSAFVMRSAPGSNELTDSNSADNSQSEDKSVNWTVREATSTSSFWILYTIFFLGMNTFLIILVNLFDYAKESGVDPLVASGALAAIAFGSIFGRLFFSGVLTKYLDNRKVLFTSYFLEALSILQQYTRPF